MKFNMDARCSRGFTGLLPHDKKSRFYFVCKSDAVVTCSCKPKEIFNRVRLRCEGKEEEAISEGGTFIRERFTGTVVDNIMEKYKCTMMNGLYQNGEGLFPTTQQHVMSFPPSLSRNPPSESRNVDEERRNYDERRNTDVSLNKFKNNRLKKLNFHFRLFNSEI